MEILAEITDYKYLYLLLGNRIIWSWRLVRTNWDQFNL